jgi:hypothetical protein
MSYPPKSTIAAKCEYDPCPGCTPPPHTFHALRKAQILREMRERKEAKPMTRRDDLIKLRDAVRAGALPEFSVTKAAGLGAAVGLIDQAHRGSLDAAKALDAALPTPEAVMTPETMALILLTKGGSRYWLLWKIDALIAQEGGE